MLQTDLEFTEVRFVNHPAFDLESPLDFESTVAGSKPLLEDGGMNGLTRHAKLCGGLLYAVALAV